LHSTLILVVFLFVKLQDIVESLVILQKEKQQEFEKAKKELELLNSKIEEQKSNIIIKENTISDQKNIISALAILSIIVVILGLNGIRQNQLLKLKGSRHA
jgi:hypothetical protein